MTPAEASIGDTPDLEQVRVAARAISGVARVTPLERSEALSGLAGTDVYLKLECLQRTGSFKLRGALSAVAGLTDAESRAGVVTASAGNHGLGVALAARLRGVRATVFVPRDAPMVKRDRIGALGATVRLEEGGYDAAHEAAVRFAAASGGTYIHAFSDPAVVAGQGTVALEIFEALPGVRSIVTPAGGGGLIVGLGAVSRARDPGVRVVGVQTVNTSAMRASLAAGRLVSPPSGPTLCDGLAGDIDAFILARAREVVDEVVVLPEEVVAPAIRRLFLEEGITVEGSGAVGPAAFYTGALRAPPGPIVIVITGGNIDPSRLATILQQENES